jgi:hypothetical protein
MRGLIIIIAVFLAVPVALAGEESLLARVTVYWASGGGGSDRDTRQHKTATGLRLRTGHCAVDPRHIPYGSRVVLADGTSLAAVDTGSAVRNREAARRSGRTINERNAVVVDRFFETKSQALAWANRHPAFMPVRVLSPNYRPAQRRSLQVAGNSAAPSNSKEPIVTALPLVQPPAEYPPVAGNSLNKLGR